ncbi:hypothetical protein D3C86_2213890 [compost metagenome]
MIDEYTISFIGDVKRYVFIRLFGVRSAISVPDINALPVLDKGSKSLSEPVDTLANAEV